MFATIFIKNSKIQYNRVAYGGILCITFFDKLSTFNLQMIKNKIKHNIASSKGGLLYFDALTANSIEPNKSQFSFILLENNFHLT